MAKKDVRTATNYYRVNLNNNTIGESLQNDPWFQKQGKDYQNYALGVFANDNKGNRINFGTAILNRQAMTEVLENAIIIARMEDVSPYRVDRKPEFYEHNYDVQEGYKQLHEQNFFTALTDKSQTSSLFSRIDDTKNPTALPYENMEGYRVHQTTGQTFDALQRIREQDGWVVAYDLETTGGKLVDKHNIGKHITEFSFVKANVLDPTQESTVYNSVIGATEQEYEEFMDIIRKYEEGTSDKVLRKTGGTPLSEEERVTAARLAKMGQTVLENGASLTTQEAVNDGIVQFTHFVGSKDIALMDPVDMRAGAEFLRDVGYLQRNTVGLKDYTIGQKRYQLYGWEAELLKGLQEIQAGGRNNTSLTALGHNVLGFDIQELNLLADSDKTSQGFKQALQDMSSYVSVDFTAELPVFEGKKFKPNAEFVTGHVTGKISGTGLITYDQIDGIFDDFAKAYHYFQLKEWREKKEHYVKGKDEPLPERPKKLTTKELLSLLADPEQAEDNPAIKEYLKGARMQIDRRQLVSKRHSSVEFDHTLDTLALSREYMSENLYDENDIRQMGELGLTANQQESLVRRLTAKTDPTTGLRDWTKTAYEDPKYMGAAHMAKTDTILNVLAANKMINYETGILTDTLSYVKQPNPFYLTKDSKALLFAKQHIYEGQGLMMFTRDAFSGEVRTSEGFALSEVLEQQENGTAAVKKKTEQQIVKPYGVQRGVVYQVKDLYSVNTSSEFHDIMKKMYPWFDLKNLTVLELQAYAPQHDNTNTVVKAHSPIYYVGQKQNIINALMDNTLMIGEAVTDATGKEIIDTSKVSDITKQQLTTWSLSEDGETEIKPFNAQEIVESSARKLEQEAAARYIRDHDYKRDKKLVDFLDQADKEINKIALAARDASKQYGSEISAEEREAAKIEFFKRLWDNSTAIAKKVYASAPIDPQTKFPVGITPEQYNLSYQKFFGYTFSKGSEVSSANLFSETLAAQTGRVNWGWQNRDLIKAVLRKAEDLAGIMRHGSGPDSDSKAALSYYYKTIMENIEDYIEYETGSKHSSRLGWQQSSMYAYEFDKNFDINLAGFKDIDSDRIVSVNLQSERAAEKAVLGAVDDLFGRGKELRNTERARILGEIQRHLYRTGQIGRLTKGTFQKKERFIADVLLGLTNHSDDFKVALRAQAQRSAASDHLDVDKVKSFISSKLNQYDEVKLAVDDLNNKSIEDKKRIITSFSKFIGENEKLGLKVASDTALADYRELRKVNLGYALVATKEREKVKTGISLLSEAQTGWKTLGETLATETGLAYTDIVGNNYSTFFNKLDQQTQDKVIESLTSQMSDDAKQLASLDVFSKINSLQDANDFLKESKEQEAANAEQSILDAQVDYAKKYFEKDEQRTLLEEKTQQALSLLEEKVDDPFAIAANDSEAVALHKFIKSLQVKREGDPFAGHLKDTARHTPDASLWAETVPSSEIKNVVEEAAKYVPHFEDVFEVDLGKNKKKVLNDRLVNKIVDTVLRDQSITDKSLADAGYTAQERKTLQRIREVHRQGLQRYVRSVFGMIGDLGGSVRIEKDSRRAIVKLGSKDTVELTIPKEQFIHGQISYQFGNQLFSMPVGIYDMKEGYGDKRELKFASLIEKAVATNEALMTWHVNEARRGEGSVRFHFDKAMSTLNEMIRKAPAITVMGLKSRSNQFRVSYADIVKNLPTLLGDNIPAIESWNAPEAHKKVIRELTTGKQVYDVNNPAYEHHIVLQANIDRLLTTAVQKGIISKNVAEDVISQFTPDIKQADKLVGQAAYHGDWYNRFNGAKRGAANIEDATQLDVTKLRAYISAAESGEDMALSGLRDVGIGKGSTDKAHYFMSVQDSTRNRQFNTHVQLTALHATPVSFNTIVANNIGDVLQDFAKRDEKVSENTVNMLLTAMPEEGLMFMHADVGDRIFNERDTTQKINIDKVINKYGNRYLGLDQKAAAMFHVDVNENNPLDISFKYGQGSFVEFGDTIAHVKGMSFDPITKGAKYEGLLKLGFFDLANGHLVSEADITETIKNMSNFATIMKLDAEQRSRKIAGLLESKYKLAYYVQTEKANPLVKIAEMAEKGMARSLIANTGSIDTKIYNIMQELGFYGGSYVAQEASWENGRLITPQVTRTLGKVDALDINMIDALKDTETLGDFAVAAQGRMQRLKGRTASVQDIKDIIGKHFKTASGETDIDAFREAIMFERRQPSRVLEALLQKAGYGDRPIHLISNHFANMVKHKDISPYRYLIDEWVYREKKGMLSEGSAAAFTKKYLLNTAAGEYSGTVSYAKDADTLIFSEEPKNLELNPTKLREAYFDTGIVSTTEDYEKLSKTDKKKVREAYINEGNMDQQYMGWSTQVTHNFKVTDGIVQKALADDANVKSQTEVVRADVSRVGYYWDRSKETEDAMKFNQRAITALSNVRADEHGMKNVKAFLDERAAAYGGEGSDIYETYLKDLKKGEIVPSAAIDQIYRNMFNRQGGGELLSGFIKQGAEGLEWGIDTDKVAKFVEKYNVGNGDAQKGANIMASILGRMRQGLEGKSITTINEAGALNLFKAYSATAAVAINTGQVTTEAEANRLGFKTIKLNDLVSGKLGSGAFDESLYGHNWLIDLGDHEVFGDSLWLNESNNTSSRYLAISANHVNNTDDFIEAIADKPQEQVKLLQDDISRYLSVVKEKGGDADERNKMLQRITDRIQAVKDAQTDYLKGKKGIMAEATRAWMHDASRTTTSGMNLLGTEDVNKILGTVEQVDNGLEGLMAYYEKQRAAGKAVDISQFEINGINLVEEARKGRHALQFNYSILSLERMDKIYDTNFGAISDALVNAGIDKSTVNDLLSQASATTKQIVQTKGVEGISAREPLQYYGSVTQRKIFFNSLASGNQSIGDFVGAQTRKEDYDSDAVVNAIHKEQAELAIATANGPKRVNIEVDSAMLEALSTQQMKDAGVSVRLLDEGAEQRFKNYQTSQYFIGAGEAQRYRITHDLKEGTYDFQFNSMAVDHLAKELEGVDSGLSQQVLRSKDMTLEERKVFQKQMGDFLRDRYQEIVKNAAWDQKTYGADFLMASGEAQRLKILEVLQKDAASLGENLYKDGSYTNLAYEALRFSYHDETLSADMVAHAGHIPTGKINRYTQNIYDVFDEVLHNSKAADYFGVDTGVLMGQTNLVNLAIQEGFLTPKNVAGSAEEDFRVTLMPKIDKAFNDAFHLSENATYEEKQAAKKQLTDILETIVVPRASNEIRRDPTLPTLSELVKKHGTKYGVNYDDLVKNTLGTAVADGETVLENKAREAVHNVVDFLVDKVAWRGNNRNIFSFAVSHGSGNKTNMPIRLPSESSQVSIQLANVMKDVMGDLGVEGALSNAAPIAAQTTAHDLDNFVGDVRRDSQNSLVDISRVPEPKKMPLKEMVRRFNMRGGGIAGAATGIVAGIMISGFANNPSNRPGPVVQPVRQRTLPMAEEAVFGNVPIPGQSLPEPAIGLAAGGAAAFAQQYPMPQFADNNLNVMRGSQPKAYMINITGASPRGQQAALRAIQGAVGGPIPQNSAINVAVNTNYQDTLSQMQVNRMVQTAMGI